MKKTFFIISSLFIFLFSCKKQNQNQNLPNTDFVYAIPQVDITENVNVGAYFYNYLATDWAKGYADVPLLGTYSALNASTMAQERVWADSAGVDFFVFNWNGATAGDPILNSFVTGRNNNVKMVIDFNTAHLSATNTSPLIGTKLTTMINEFKSLVTSRFSQNYYYTINGQPVVLITPLNLASSASTSIDYTTVIPALRKSLDSIGVHPYIIGEITSGWLPPIRYASAIKVMDGVTLTDWSTTVYDRSVFFAPFVDQNWKNWTDTITPWKVDFVPCIFPGFNDKVITPTSANYNINKTDTFYNDYTNVAKRNMSSKRLVLINSWNDFQKGTGIEPAVSYNRTFMTLTKKQFKVK